MRWHLISVPNLLTEDAGGGVNMLCQDVEFFTSALRAGMLPFVSCTSLISCCRWSEARVEAFSMIHPNQCYYQFNAPPPRRVANELWVNRYAESGGCGEEGGLYRTVPGF